MKLIKITKFPDMTPISEEFTTIWIPAYLESPDTFWCYEITDLYSREISDEVFRRVIKIDSDYVVVFSCDEKVDLECGLKTTRRSTLVDLELSQILLKQLSVEYIKDVMEYEYEKLQYCNMHEEIAGKYESFFYEVSSFEDKQLILKYPEMVKGFDRLPRILSNYWYIRAKDYDKTNKKIINSINLNNTIPSLLDESSNAISDDYIEILNALDYSENWYELDILHKIPLLIFYNEDAPILKIYTKEGIETLGKTVPKFTQTNTRYVSGDGVVLDFFDCSHEEYIQLLDTSLPRYIESNDLKDFHKDGPSCSELIAYDFQEKKYLISPFFIINFMDPEQSINDELSAFLLRTSINCRDCGYSWLGVATEVHTKLIDILHEKMNEYFRCN